MKNAIFNWKCGECRAKSKTPFVNKEDAARTSVQSHKKHSNAVYVISEGEYVGLSQGILFNTSKKFGIPTRLTSP